MRLISLFQLSSRWRQARLTCVDTDICHLHGLCVLFKSSLGVQKPPTNNSGSKFLTQPEIMNSSLSYHDPRALLRHSENYHIMLLYLKKWFFTQVGDFRVHKLENFNGCQLQEAQSPLVFLFLHTMKLSLLASTLSFKTVFPCLSERKSWQWTAPKCYLDNHHHHAYASCVTVKKDHCHFLNTYRIIEPLELEGTLAARSNLASCLPRFLNLRNLKSKSISIPHVLPYNR